MVIKASTRDVLREIKKTISRFVSISILLVLAVTFFAGLRATQPDMRLTADGYFDQHNVYDLRIRSTLGLTEVDLDAMRAIEGVSAVEGQYKIDAVAHAQGQDVVLALQTSLPGGLDTPELLRGRLPEQPEECAVEEHFLELTGLKLGESFDIRQMAAGFEGALGSTTFKIVGAVRSPLYISKAQRGSSTLGNGNIAAFCIIPREAVTLDYYTQAAVTVTGAAGETTYTDAYKGIVAPVLDRLDRLGETQAPARQEEMKATAQKKLSEGREALQQKTADMEAAAQKLADGKKSLADGQSAYDVEKARVEAALAEALSKLEAGEAALAEGRQQLVAAQNQLDSQKAAATAQASAVLGELFAQQQALNDADAAYKRATASYEAELTAWQQLTVAERQAQPERGRRLEETGIALVAQKQQLDGRQKALTGAATALQNQKAAGDSQLQEAQAQIDAGKDALAMSREQAAAGRQEYDRQKAAAQKGLADAEAKLQEAEATVRDGEAALKDGGAKLEEGKEALRDAEAKASEIPAGKWYVEDRTGNLGYSGFGDDADRMGALSNVFPIIFFAVAALVALTTMTRMVDDKRSEIGAYKALGHSFMTTAGKFVLYSLFATLLGVLGGGVVGFCLLPQLIFHTYTVMYDLPALKTPLHMQIFAIAAGAALVSCVGVTLLASWAALRETPSSLLRPKSPEPGQRVLLEYITPLWRRLSFFGKVSARNIFRYKKRLVMTLVGIAGCTALIVTGFGLRDAVTDIADIQFGQIFRYNMVVYLKGGADMGALQGALSEDKEVSDSLLAQGSSVDVSKSGALVSGRLVVPSDMGGLQRFITLKHRAGGAAVALTDEGAVITEKMAELLHLKVGDTMTVDNGGNYAVRVADITENYVYHYIYMTPAYYKEVFGRAQVPNQVFLTLREDTDQVAGTVSTALLKDSDVAYTSHVTASARNFKESMNSINAVVAIILLSAALLAFVVLYNLTTINIAERARELATIKVLGFYDREVGLYIFRENTILTALGIGLGLIGGRFLLAWLVKTVELNMVMFGREAGPLSYVFAALLTIIFALVVNLVGQRLVKRIDMAQSLKTNE